MFQNCISFRGISSSNRMFHENKNGMYTKESSKKLPSNRISSRFLYSAVELWNYTNGINSASEKTFHADLVILRVVIPCCVSISKRVQRDTHSRVLCWQVLFSNLGVTQRWQLGTQHQEGRAVLLEKFIYSLNLLLWWLWSCIWFCQIEQLKITCLGQGLSPD